MLGELKADLAKSEAELDSLRRQQPEAERERQELERTTPKFTTRDKCAAGRIERQDVAGSPSRDEAERRNRDLEEEKKRARIALDEATKSWPGG